MAAAEYYNTSSASPAYNPNPPSYSEARPASNSPYHPLSEQFRNNGPALQMPIPHPPPNHHVHFAESDNEQDGHDPLWRYDLPIQPCSQPHGYDAPPSLMARPERMGRGGGDQSRLTALRRRSSDLGCEVGAYGRNAGQGFYYAGPRQAYENYYPSASRRSRRHSSGYGYPPPQLNTALVPAGYPPDYAVVPALQYPQPQAHPRPPYAHPPSTSSQQQLAQPSSSFPYRPHHALPPPPPFPHDSTSKSTSTSSTFTPSTTNPSHPTYLSQLPAQSFQQPVMRAASHRQDTSIYRPPFTTLASPPESEAESEADDESERRKGEQRKEQKAREDIRFEAKYGGVSEETPARRRRSLSAPARHRHHHDHHQNHHEHVHEHEHEHGRGRAYEDREDDRGDGRKTHHDTRNTFLGTVGGAAIGDAIFPGLGTLGGAVLGGWGGHEVGRGSGKKG